LTLEDEGAVFLHTASHPGKQNPEQHSVETTDLTQTGSLKERYISFNYYTDWYFTLTTLVLMSVH